MRENPTGPMEIAQKFSLGSLISASGISTPSQIKVEVQGRGTFCRVAMEFLFASDDPTSPRLFTVERPWNAVLVKVALNGDQARRSNASMEPKALPVALKPAVEEALQDGPPEIVSAFVEAGQSLRSITLEFLLSCDVLWHQSSLGFGATSSACSLELDVTWDLSGLPGAQLECLEAAKDSRFGNLDGSRCQWSESFSLRPEEKVGILLVLDEKKAASICLYSNVADPDGQGCGAVVVVAPVRQHLLRKPVRVAVVVEIRNPQEGLLTRDLVDQLSGVLNPQDQIAIFFMGSSVTRNILDWRPAREIQEDDIAHLLEPSLMGRTQYFWESFQRVLEDCQGATHIVLSTPGPLENSPDDLVCHLPIFCFATGRKPNVPSLDDLASRSGGFLSEQSIDGIECFLQRLNIRLSPPLLRDFRLEGWGLEKVYPPGVTQVYTDKPTLVLGLYDGLLPQTVTLGGLSPAGQKLAQRVRVENFTQFDLMPLFEERSRGRVTSETCVRRVWGEDKFQLFEAARPVPTTDIFALEASDSETESELFGPPSIELVSNAAVELDEVFLFNKGDEASDDLFSSSVDSGSTVTDDFFSSAPSAQAPTFLDEDPFAENESLFEKSEAVQEESPDTFQERDDLEAPFRPVINLASAEQDEEEEPGAFDFDTPPAMDFDVGPHPDEIELSFGPDSQKEEFEFPVLEPPSEPDPLPEPENSLEPEPSNEPPEPSQEPEPSPEATHVSPESLESPVQNSFDTISSAPAGFRSHERPTLTVAIPGWVRRLSFFDGELIHLWLSKCSIDDLALALVDTEQSIAYSFLEKLDGSRKVAVELQMEYGKLLSPEERREACRKLEAELETLPA